MTPRPHAWTRRAALATLFAGTSLITIPGCDPRALLFFLQPTDPTIEAPGPSLKGKKVVVLAHVPGGVGSDYGDLSRDLTREVTKQLRKSVKKIQVVDAEKVASWSEAHPSWNDPTEAGKAFEADMVLFLDVSEFQTEDPRSPNLMEGTSNIHLQLWEFAHPKDDKEKEKKNQPKEWTKAYDEQADTTFPTRGPVSRDTGVSSNSFRIKFLKLVATEVTWHFAEHAPGDDIQDVKFSPSDKNN